MQSGAVVEGLHVVEDGGARLGEGGGHNDKRGPNTKTPGLAGVAGFDYGFDAAHRIKYEQRDSGAADGFGYDARNQLTAYQRDGSLNANGTVSAAYNLTINYDANGNRINADEGCCNAVYTTAPNNEYASDWTGALPYDNNANLTGRAGWIFGYDAQNRLISIDGGNTHIRYHYDPLNRIVARETNGDITTNVWDNWNLIEERTWNNELRRLYFWGANTNEIVASYGPAYGDLFYFQDGRGNVTHLADPSNTVVERYTYFVSGQPNTTYSSGPSRDNQFLFGGARFIREAEIYDMRNRFYHPNLGRFMQSDPIGFDAGDMNLFRYCGNDPVNNTDPTGLAGVGLTSWGNGQWVTGSDGINYEDRHWMGDNRDNDPHDHHAMGTVKSIDSNSEGAKTQAAGGGEKKGFWQRIGGPPDFDLDRAAEQIVSIGLPAGRGAGLLSRIPWIGRFFGGASIRTVNDVLRNPALLKGKTPDQVRALLASTPGWRVEALGRGAHQGQGFILRQYTPAGNPTGRVIQWHPGGGHHGPKPYWKVRSGEGGVSPEIPAGL